MQAARQKMMREKYTRQVELLSKNAREGHLPSLDLLAHDSRVARDRRCAHIRGESGGITDSP
jgi:hypothetical protein